MNCIQPINWEYCLPVHEWLIPELIEGYKIWSNPSSIYEKERIYLRGISSIGRAPALQAGG